MSGPQFFETRMGQQFYDGTMRRIGKALESIATSLERLADVQEKPKPGPHPTEWPRGDHWYALVGEMVELLYDHAKAWEGEEASVKTEHAALIAQTDDLLQRLKGPR